MILDPVKVAVIGCEGYSHQWIRRLLSVPDRAQLVAVSALDPDSPSADFCRQYGVTVCETVDELLGTPDLEAVVNPTPIHLHQSLTRQCLEAGIPVWLEKPPVATVQDYDKLLSAVRKSGLSVPVCFNSLFTRLTQQLKRELVEGRFGAIRRIKGLASWVRTNAYFTRSDWAGRVSLDGQWVLDGTLNNVFAHVLCNNLFFAGREQPALATLAEIQAELYRCNMIESEDTSCSRLVTHDGVEILNYLTVAGQSEIPPLTVIETERAEIHYENFDRIRIRHRDGRLEERESYQEHRIEMITHLCRARRLQLEIIGEIGLLRPFVEAVNGAFDSSGVVHAVSGPHHLAQHQQGVSHYQIVDLEAHMRKAFVQNALFSEIGVPWARAGDRFSPADYSAFPQRFGAGTEVENRGEPTSKKSSGGR